MTMKVMSVVRFIGKVYGMGAYRSNEGFLGGGRAVRDHLDARHTHRLVHMLACTRTVSPAETGAPYSEESRMAGPKWRMQCLGRIPAAWSG